MFFLAGGPPAVSGEVTGTAAIRGTSFFYAHTRLNTQQLSQIFLANIFF